MSKTLAREWLIFLGCLTVGVIVAGPIVSVLNGGQVADFYHALGLKNDSIYFWRAFAIACAPYVATQFARSILWAVRRLGQMTRAEVRLDHGKPGVAALQRGQSAVWAVYAAGRVR